MIFTAENAPSLSDSWVVYTLASSLTPDFIRYVGITNDLRRRLSHHISESRRYSTRKARWVALVLREGGIVIARINIAGVTQIAAKAREVDLIAKLRGDGSDLVNLTDGGDGTVGRRHSADARAKMAAAKRGTKASDETRRKMSEARRGKPSGRLGEKMPQSVKERITQSLLRLGKDPAIRAQRSAAMIARYLDIEARRKTSLGERNKPPTARNKSGYKGVSYCRQTGRWVAQIKIDRIRHLGRFSTPEDAARAYDNAARTAWGSECYLNFGSK